MPAGHGARVRLRQGLRRTHVARLYLEGKNQYQIADALKQLGMEGGQQLVSTDIKAITDEWKAARIRDYDALVTLEMQRIAALEQEYRDGWLRSRQPRKVEHTRAVEGDRARQEASVQQEERVGNPRFLDGIGRCIDRRRALLGLDVPQRIPVDLDSLTTAQLRRLAVGEPFEQVVSAPPMAQA